MLGRGDVQTDDILELGGEVGIGRALEGADTVRLEDVRRPNPLHRTQGDARVPGHGPAGPVGRFTRRLSAGQGHDPAHGLGGQGRLARLAGGVAQQPLDRLRRTAVASATPRTGRSPLAGRPRRCSADRPSPNDRARATCFWARLRSRRWRETSTILGRNPRANALSHRPSIAHPLALVNRSFASVHYWNRQQNHQPPSVIAVVTVLIKGP